MIKKEIVKGSGRYRRYDRHSRHIEREIRDIVGEEVYGMKLRHVLIFLKSYYGAILRGNNNIYIRDEKEVKNRLKRYKQGSRHWFWCYKQRKGISGGIKGGEGGGEGEEVKDM